MWLPPLPIPQKALAHPYRGQSTSDAVTLEPLVEAFADLGEATTIRIVTNFRAHPMDGGVSVQRSAN